MKLLASNHITVACSDPCPTVAMLRPRSGHSQWVVAERYGIDPWMPATEYVDGYGNLCQRFVAPRGQTRFRIESELEVADHVDVDHLAGYTPIDQLPADVLIFLLQSRYCPSDKMADHAQRIVQGCQPGYAQVERIRSWMHETLEYKYGVSDASTDAIETLECATGVCRDFAHLGIALCRSLMIPARAVAGYMHQLDPMDMHAWFEAFVGGRWFTFDATQAEPRGGRVVVSYGRDAADIAFLSNYGPMEVEQMEVSVERVGG